MNNVALTARRVKYENRAFWRNPASAFFTFAFPLMFLVIFNLIFGSGTTTGPTGQEISLSNFYTASIAAFSIITATYTNLAISVSFSRDFGILKRMRGTPLPGPVYLMGRVLHSVLVCIILVAIVTLFGALFYDVDVPTSTMPALIVTLIIGAASFCSLGLAMTAAVPNADASPAVVNATILPLLFISDVFIPLEQAPDWLQTVAKIFPIKHLSDAMQAVYSPFTEGSGFKWGDLLVIGLWGIAGLALAIKFFSWEPRR
jgi:ABC-2 type transport system permease protein